MGPSRPPWKQVAPQGPRREGRAWATGQEWLQKEARPSGHTPKAMSPGGQPARRDTGKHEWERPRRAESFTIRGAQRPGIALGPASDSVTARPQVRPLPSCNGAPTGLSVIHTWSTHHSRLPKSRSESGVHVFQTFSKMTSICSSGVDAIFRKTRNVRSHIQWVTRPTGQTAAR